MGVQGVRGIGVDSCHIQRIERVWQRFGPRFEQRLLTPAEQASKQWQPASLAKRWAMKEAVAKALGVGIGKALSFQDITISYGASGQPVCKVQGVPGEVLVSVSDENTTAGGCAVAFALWQG